jgi:hypothetical protein
MSDRIDLNTADPKEMTQLPGISTTIAKSIANQRQRHGWFTAWEELLAVKNFPADKLEQIRQRAMLSCPEDRPGQTQTECTPPRHLNVEKIAEQNGVRGYTRKLRASRRTEKLHTNVHPRAS